MLPVLALTAQGREEMSLHQGGGATANNRIIRATEAGERKKICAFFFLLVRITILTPYK